MQELFNLVNIRQMYNQELNLAMVEKFDTLISLVLDNMNSKLQLPPESPTAAVVE